MSTRVLLVGREWRAGWTESTARALNDLGCTVTVFDYVGAGAGVTGQVNWWRGQITSLLQRRVPQWVRTANGWRMGRRVGQALVRAAKDCRPDVVLVLKGEILQPEAIVALKQMTGVPVAAWWVDDPFNLEGHRFWRNAEQLKCFPLYDRLFVFDHSYLGPLKELGVERASYLPCAADPVLYHPQRVVEPERSLYSATISFVGRYFENRGEVIDGIAKEPGLRIWGPDGWDRFLAARLGDSWHSCFGGWGLPPDQVAKVYVTSMINLNIHEKQSHQLSRKGCLNTRAFEIPSTGGFQLMDRVRGMEELLEPGREVAVYDTPRQVPELVRHYLNDTAGRARIAQAGRERVLAQHTYRHRMTTVLNSI